MEQQVKGVAKGSKGQKEKKKCVSSLLVTDSTTHLNLPLWLIIFFKPF